MMRLRKDRIPHIAVVMALVGLGVPSMASAASWATVGSTHMLDSSNLLFSSQSLNIGLICTNSQFHIDVTNGEQLTITGIAMNSCDATGTGGSGCIATVTPVLPHWTITGTSNTDIRIRLHMNVTFDGTCAGNGTFLTVTGTVKAGVWSQVQHEIVYTNAEGVNADAGVFGSPPMTISGTIRDTTQSLDFT